MNPAAEKIIARLGLAPLPREGGFFRQTWLSSEMGPDGRQASSAILFLLTSAGFSALHRLRTTEELWYFHAGDPVEHVQLAPIPRVVHLGPDLLSGHTPQITVPKNAWQGARLADPAHGWALLSCSLTPGWDERDFELGDRRALLAQFPGQEGLITALTRTES